MHFKDEDAFAKALREQKPHGAYLLYGNEGYLIHLWAQKLSAPFGGHFSSFNLQKLDGKRLNVDALYDATEALPLMADEKCVLVEDLEPSALSSTDLSKLEALLADLNPGCLLVITGRAPGFDPKTAPAKRLLALVEKNGATVELSARGQAGLIRFLKGVAKKNGCEASTELCRYILQVCENDMGALHGEMEKICAYAGGGPLQTAHVDAVAIPRTEARVFDVSKAILSGNTQRAMELLENLFFLREPPLAILSTLVLTFVDMYRARVAKESGATVADVVKLFSYKGDFRVRTAFAARLSARQLRAALDILLDCDLKMKSTGADGRILLEQTVTRLFAVCAG